jgi:hypothetical protein
MRRLLSVLLGLLLLVSLVPPLAGHAQTPDQPLVVFIEDERSSTTSIQDNGPDGISELARIFENAGARTRWILMNQPIPDDAQVLVLVRPLTPLSVDYVARLWVQMMRGKALLLTLDPSGPTVFRGEGNARSNPDRSNAGLPTLLSQVYGITMQDTLVAEPWFTTAIVQDNRTGHLVAHVEQIVQHPALDPLGALDLPVEVWDARSMRVEPFGPHSYAVPLIYTQTAYGETNLSGVFNAKDPVPLELNLGPDPVGTLLLGALGENTLTGSRVVVLGDSEMVENGYGLVNWIGTDQPIHVANRVLVERLAAWLLGRPVEEWPTLPATYTQLAVDGNNTDWADRNPVMQDDTGDALVPLYDIQDVRAFRDDRFMYVLVDLTEPPKSEVRLTLGFENTFDGVVDVTVVLTTGETLSIPSGGEPVVVPDGTMAVGSAIEVRLALRIIGDGALIMNACLADSRTPLESPPIDCVGQTPVVIPVANTVSPFDTANDGPQAIVDTLQAGVNVRAEPSTDSEAITTAYDGQVFSVTGRTALGDWIQVQNAIYTGWMADFLLKPNISIGELPIVTPQP